MSSNPKIRSQPHLRHLLSVLLFKIGDEAQPGCQRCERANLVCPGYKPPKARIFIPSGQLDVEPTSLSTATQQGYTVSHPLVAPSSIDLRLTWQKGLIDAFLTRWLPHSLVRDCAADRAFESKPPMSRWPSVAWKLAKKDDDNLVAHSLLCLTLCVLGTQTGDNSLIGEASSHYARVLQQFQAQVSLLARSKCPSKQSDHVASLATAGFCCSQIEYILQSWSNGDRHLQGMETLLQACGPSILEDEDTRNVFLDHALLWISCSVTHRRPAIYSKWPWQDAEWKDVAPSCRSARELISIAERVPCLLEEYDTSHQSRSPIHMVDLLRRFAMVIEDLEKLNLSYDSAGSLISSTTSDQPNAVPDFQYCHTWLSRIMMAGYSSAFLVQTAIAAWSIVRMDGDSLENSISDIDLSESRLQSLCEHHIQQLRDVLIQLSDDRHGMITASALLHFMDSAWMAIAAVAEYCGRDLSVDRAWFEMMGTHVASTGYRPLREPWLKISN